MDATREDLGTAGTRSRNAPRQLLQEPQHAPVALLVRTTERKCNASRHDCGCPRSHKMRYWNCRSVPWLLKLPRNIFEVMGQR